MSYSLTVKGGNALKGKLKVSGAKNVAMKVILASLLTDQKIVCRNVPHISSVENTGKVIEILGGKIDFENHKFEVNSESVDKFKIPLELGGIVRTSSMVLGPLLARFKKAIVPNPGGCRLGARPINRHIDGLKKMGAEIEYRDGYFFAETSGLHGTEYTFEKTTHTGTESLILAAVLAEGETVLKNAAEEPEIDDLINMLKLMGAKITREKKRVIKIQGVNSLKGVDYEIMPDRNEVVTFAIAGLMTQGDVSIENARENDLVAFLRKLDEVGAFWEKTESGLRFKGNGVYRPADVVTEPHPGFMTDWQPLWTVFATQFIGKTVIHETIFEDKFRFVPELWKLGAKIELFNPQVEEPEKYYNFNWEDNKPEYFHAVLVYGPTSLHEGILRMTDIRAGAAVLIGALAAKNHQKSVIYDIDQLDRGYEKLEDRLNLLGADIKKETY